MKLTQILIMLLSLTYGHSAFAMKKPRRARHQPKKEVSILKIVLESEHQRTRKTISKCVMHKAPKAQDLTEIAKPLLNQISEHEKALQKLSVKIAENYKARLNTLYDKVLELDQIKLKTTPATELPAFRDMIMGQIINLKQARLDEVQRFTDNRLNFQDISPIVNAFKKEKQFIFEPHLNTSDLETILKFHAMLSALTYSLREIDEWIHAKAEIEYDI